MEGEKKYMTSVGKSIPGHLGLVKLGIAHKNDAAAFVNLREKLFL